MPKTRRDPDLKQIADFKQTVLGYYKEHGRDLPWRHTQDPYHILVSEIMLQQTQVDRVIPKYTQFLLAFPDFQSLAQARLGEVLSVWQGLGYNRRAQYVHQIAERIVAEFDGQLADDAKVLQTLPGIGEATAASICAFAFNEPVVFIETNIRRVFIHHFFADQTLISDAQILPLVARTLDQQNPRRWYWALMDYGSWLSSQVPNPNTRSKHYTKQAPFRGSRRQVRGRILQLLVTEKKLTRKRLGDLIDSSDADIESCIQDLQHEGLVEVRRSIVYLP